MQLNTNTCTFPQKLIVALQYCSLIWKSCLLTAAQQSDKPVRHVVICFCGARSSRAGTVQWEDWECRRKSFCCGSPLSESNLHSRPKKTRKEPSAGLISRDVRRKTAHWWASVGRCCPPAGPRAPRRYLNPVKMCLHVWAAPARGDGGG